MLQPSQRKNKAKFDSTDLAPKLFPTFVAGFCAMRECHGTDVWHQIYSYKQIWETAKVSFRHFSRK
jgi:hypothetical protein